MEFSKLTTNRLRNLHKIPVRSLACKVQLFTMPSGDVLCHVARSVRLTFDDAQAFCQDVGLRGLAEGKTHADQVFIAGVDTCNLYLEF